LDVGEGVDFFCVDAGTEKEIKDPFFENWGTNVRFIYTSGS